VYEDVTQDVVEVTIGDRCMSAVIGTGSRRSERRWSESETVIVGNDRHHGDGRSDRDYVGRLPHLIRRCTR